LAAGCKGIYNDNSVHNQPAEKSALVFDPTNSTPKLKVPVEVQVEAKSTNEVRLPVNVNVEPVSDAPLKVTVAVTNDAASPLILPVILKADTNGIPIKFESLTKPWFEWKLSNPYLGDLVKLFLAALLASFLAFYCWRMQKRIEFTIGFSEKYHSSEMIAARKRAWEYLSEVFDANKTTRAVTKKTGRGNQKVKMSDIADGNLYSGPCIICTKLPAPPSLGDVLIMLHYFERIAVMGKNRFDILFNSSHCMVNQKMVREHLGYEFLFWYQYIKHLRDDELGVTEADRKNSDSTWKQLFENIEHASPWLIPAGEKDKEKGIAGSPLR
jgi:hypothetical protein